MQELAEILTVDKSSWHFLLNSENRTSKLGIKKERKEDYILFFRELVLLFKTNKDSVHLRNLKFPDLNNLNTSILFREATLDFKELLSLFETKSILIDSCTFLSIDIRYCDFNFKKVNIVDCTFVKSFSLRNCTFKESLKIRKSRFKKSLNFYGTKFLGDLVIDKNFISENFRLYNCSILDYGKIRDITSLNDFQDYNYVVFLQEILYNLSVFNRYNINKTVLSKSLKSKGLNNINFKEKGIDKIFEDIKRLESLDFYNKDFALKVKNTRIEKQLSITGCYLRHISLSGSDVDKIDLLNNINNIENRLIFDDEKQIKNKSYNLYIKELIRLYRGIKNSSEQNKDFELAGHAFKSEMHFRLIELWQDKKYGEYIISKTYKWLCEYNLNYTRPLYLLLLSFSIFIIPYIVIDFDLVSAIKKSFSGTLPLIIKSSESPSENNYFYWVYSFQTLISTILLALFILSLRRRLK